MSKILRVLYVEDSERDAELLTRELSRAGYDPRCERVETAAAMKAALESQDWDVILCDYSMPHFDGLSAVALLKEMGLDIPLIIISGTVGEAVAVQAMHAGALDYLMKDDMARLGSTIERSIHEVRNLRARRRAEEQLLVSEQRLHRALASSPAVIYTLETDGFFPTWISENIVSVLGYEAEECLAPSWWNQRVHGEDRERELAGLSELLSSGHRVSHYRFLRKDGAYRWVRDEQRVLRNERGEPVEIVGAWVDVTRQRHADEALLEANQALQSLVQTSPLAILALDLEGNVKSWNSAAERIFDWSEKDVIGRRNPIVPEDRLEESHNFLDITRKGGTFTGFETVRIKKDRSVIDVSLSAAPLIDGKGNVHGSVVVIADITERKLLEEQFRQSQKMEAIGRLAGGVAHDFNNLLTAIIGYSQMALARLPPGDPMRKDIGEIEKAGHRAAGLTSQLLAFSRRQVIQPKVLDLNAVVVEVSKLLNRLIGEDVELKTSLDPETGFVKADRGQIEQIIVNLAINSRDAMPGGGRLTVETANVDLDESYAAEHVDARAGPHVMLAISDNGSGIDKETRLHIFEPFFTTKEQGKGTGLGLSTVYGIVKQNGGHIGLYSEPGRGTTFKVYLPRIEEAAGRRDSGELQTECPDGVETILLVEDEDSVRKLTRKILEASGYTVLEASSGDETHLICENHQGPIHLLLTDVVMLGPSGREVAENLAPSRPDMKVLYMSGYTDDAIVHHGVLDEDTPFLPKPFTRASLLRKVRDVLDG
jgi:two-component system, cell cycle sensor histidine kinase and response regulator CckA